MSFDCKQNSVVYLEDWRIGRVGVSLSNLPALHPSRLITDFENQIL